MLAQQQVFLKKKFSYDEFRQIQKLHIRPKKPLNTITLNGKRALEITEKDLEEANSEKTPDFLWKAVEEEKKKQSLFTFLTDEDKDKRPEDKANEDELFDSYVEFCKRAIAMQDYKPLLAIPSIRKEFESFTSRVVRHFIDDEGYVNDETEAADIFDNSPFFSDFIKAESQTEFNREKVTAMINNLTAEISDLREKYPNGEKEKEILVISIKISELNELIKNCTWHSRWISKAKQIVHS